MSNMDVAEKVKHFITTNFYVRDPACLTPQASFFQEGILDSTGVLEVMSFLEESFGFVINDNEVIPENLDSLEGINRFVERKLSDQPHLHLLPSEGVSSLSASSGSPASAPLVQPLLAPQDDHPR